MRVHVVVPTHDRPAALRLCLSAVATQEIPPGWDVSVIAVENGSDGASGIAGELGVAYLHLPMGNASAARNRGAAEGSDADVIVLLDDDSVPSPGWLTAIASPLVSGLADATVGAVTLDLDDPTSGEVSDAVRGFFVDTALAMDRDAPFLIGMNMAMTASVFRYLGGFDLELGPGALGGGEDVLLGLRLLAQGGAIEFVPGAVVTHHVPADRLGRGALLARTQGGGRGDGWIMHHWHHHRPTHLRARILASWVASHWPRRGVNLTARQKYWCYRQLLAERNVPAKY